MSQSQLKYHHPNQGWTTELRQCSENKHQACFGCCCPCVLFGQNRDALYGDGCCTGCIIHCVLACTPFCCLLPWFSAPFRREMRLRYGGLEGTNKDDRVHHRCWNCCCANCQEAREIENRSAVMWDMLGGHRHDQFEWDCVWGSENISAHIPPRYRRAFPTDAESAGGLKVWSMER
eukprot:GFYU01011763.1.p1 GENE.GFYU01011763.1~~GFYU01011763.1.p1  ORF type:complete len:176 (-),score=2.87 GFYU01011763.1:242-769(-)